MVKFKLVRLCREGAMSVIPNEKLRYDLEMAAQMLQEKGYDVAFQGVMVIAKVPDHEVTLYSSGRILLSQVESKERATEVANRVYDMVEGSLESLPSMRS